MNKPQFGNAVTPTRAQTDGRREVSNRIFTQLYSTRRTAARYETNSQLGNQYGLKTLNPTAESIMNSRNACRLARASMCYCHLTTHLSHTTTIAASDTGPEPSCLPYPIPYQKIGHVGEGGGSGAAPDPGDLFPSKSGRYPPKLRFASDLKSAIYHYGL